MIYSPKEELELSWGNLDEAIEHAKRLSLSDMSSCVVRRQEKAGRGTDGCNGQADATDEGPAPLSPQILPQHSVVLFGDDKNVARKSSRSMSEFSWDDQAAIFDEVPLPVSSDSPAPSRVDQTSIQPGLHEQPPSTTCSAAVGFQCFPNPATSAAMHEQSETTTGANLATNEPEIDLLHAEVTHQQSQDAYLALEATLVEDEPITFDDLINLVTMAEIDVPVASAFPGEGAMDVLSVLRLRNELKYVFGWKRDFGPLTTSEGRRRGHALAEAQADRYLRNCFRASGGDADQFDRMMGEFDRLRRAFGWKEEYSVFTPRLKAAAKREKAERRAENALAEMSFGDVIFA